MPSTSSDRHCLDLRQRPVTAPGRLRDGRHIASSSTAAPTQPFRGKPFISSPQDSHGVSLEIPQRPSKLSPNPAASTASLAASEAWSQPEDSDSDYVRKTYLHFERHGIDGDGTVQGQEWTRNRSPGITPWTHSDGGRVHRSNGQQMLRSAKSAGLMGAAAPILKPRQGMDNGVGASIEREQTCYSQTQNREGQKHSLRPLTSISSSVSSFGSTALPQQATLQESNQDASQGRSSPATNDVNASDAARSQQEAKAEDWSRIDRYGFFDSRDTEPQCRSNRIVALPSACYDVVPPTRRRLASSSKGSAASRAAVQAVERLQSESGLSLQNGVLVHHPDMEKHPDQQEPTSKSETDMRESRLLRKDAPSLLREEAADLSRRKEQERIDKWAQMLEPVDSQPGNTTSHRVATKYRGSVKLEQRVFKGIPDRWRAAAWWALSESEASESQRPGSSQRIIPSKSALESAATTAAAGPTSPTRTPSRTEGASHEVSPLKAEPSPLRHVTIQDSVSFRALMEASSLHDVQIDLDVPRTINNHVVFYTRYGLGQRSLFRVLHAFSLHCPECGYCQGMGGIAVTLLCYLEEERSWAMMRRLHDAHERFGLHLAFAPGFPGLLELFYVQGQILRLLCPQLADLLQRENVTPSSYATRWYITLFYNVVPFETQLRLWDVVMLLGSHDVLPLFGVAILHALSLTVFFPCSRNKVGSEGKENPSRLDFESIMSTLSSSNLFVPESDDAMMRWIHVLLRNKAVQKTMQEARKEWQGIVAKGEEGRWM